LKLKCDEPLSNVVFNFNLRHYAMVTTARLRKWDCRNWHVPGVSAVHTDCTPEGSVQTAQSFTCGVCAAVKHADTTVGRCRLTASKPELKLRLVSALVTNT
jgi:hypothetical protein